MKKSIAIVTLLLISFGVYAAPGDENISYIKTWDNVYFGQDVKVGLFNSKIISSDGEVTKISNRDVIAYMDNSRLFEYLPVMNESNEVICYAMMEYITCRSGLRLYRYECYEANNTRCYYFIFKDGNYYLQINQRNALTVLPFFGINDFKLS